ncbi:hypothetical protein [Pedobacter sp. MW01-1-1]|uniref:hypothetical protein n=1 Tax=Pedobacter sp. MW01-1-1 TaxID=3383027 RepID=UPI003FF12AF8
MNNLSLTLTSSKCELLDNILGLFGAEQYIKSALIAKLFRGNEVLAADYLSILEQLDLIFMVGKVKGYPLPAIVGKQPGLDRFLDEGGFMRRFELKRMQEEAGKNLEELQIENIRLKHTVEMLQKKINDLEATIRNLSCE